MKKDGIKRIVALLLCLSLGLGVVAYRPQKADAIAVTTTTVVIAATAAVMTACGVSYWANTQQDAISYLGGKIDNYLDTLSNNSITYEEWLNVYSPSALFSVIGNGVLSLERTIANKILDFVRWYNQEEGVTSGGSAVGEMGGVVTPTVTSSYSTVTNFAYTVGNNGFTVNAGSWIGFSTSSRYTGLMFNLADLGLKYGDTVTISWSPAHPCTSTYSYASYPYTSKTSSDWYINLGFAYSTTDDLGSIDWSVSTINTDNRLRAWGYSYSTKTLSVNQASYKYLYVTFGQYFDRNYNPSRLTFNNDFNVTFNKSTRLPDVAKVTPSSTVLVPQALDVGQTLEVSTNANIVKGNSADEATSAILDKVVTQSGLSSSSVTEGEAVPSAWVWLYDLVHGIPKNIAEAVQGLFVPAEGFVADFVDTLYATFSDRVGVLTYPLAVAENFMLRFLTESVGDPVVTWSAVREPFSNQVLIQAGSYNFNTMLSDQQMERVYEILQLVLKAGMAFALFDLCRKKYNTIIHGEAS